MQKRGQVYIKKHFTSAFFAFHILRKKTVFLLESVDWKACQNTQPWKTCYAEDDKWAFQLVDIDRVINDNLEQLKLFRLNIKKSCFSFPRNVDHVVF